MGQDDSEAVTGRRPRIFFVDDEPLVIRSLRRTLAGHSGSWDICFAENAEVALDMAAENAPDIVVSDMRMPGMDGAAFLTRIQDRYPDVVRIILSGHTEPRLVFRAVPVAHQFLTKPFESALLVKTLERAIGLRRLVGDAKLRAIVGANNRLPAAPATYMALSRALARDTTSLTDVVALIEQSPALAARIVQLAASSFFRVPRAVTGLGGYVSYLGIEIIKTLVLSVEIVHMFGSKTAAASGFSIDAFQAHSTDVGHIARRIVTRREQAEDAFLAGILHDIGRLVLASRLPTETATALSLARDTGVPLWQAEFEVFGTTHADVGAYLLGIWGLPIEIVDAVARHHQPAMLHSNFVTTGGSVYVANAFAHAQESATTTAGPDLDADYVRGLGDNARIEAWKDAAHEIAGASG